MRRHSFLLLFLYLIPISIYAQMRQWNAAEIAEGMAKLSVKGSVLYIAAHPDDENTRLLAYLANEKKMRVGYLSLTRGDGGQNLIGNEQAELLGLIRTQELLAARRVDGAEQFFTRANDFGFSKTADESFKIWNKEQILADVVWIIRNFKPDLIITRFPEDSRAGHGHHAGSAILAREAFFAAADPNRFPEQLAFTKVWKAERIVWNAFNFGGNNTTSPDQLTLDVGGYNPLLGKSYGEIAAISRTNHKSQGFGSSLQRGEAIEYFGHVAGSKASKSIFENLSLSHSNQAIKEALTELQIKFAVSQPELSLPSLLKLKKITQGRDFNHALLNELILACAGIWIEANTSDKNYAVGDSIPVRLQAISRTNLPVSIKVSDRKPVQLTNNKMSNTVLNLGSSIKNITQPYWLTKPHPIGQYAIEQQNLVGLPENPNPLHVSVEVQIQDQKITINSPVLFKSTDPIKGEIYQNLVIAPPITVTPTEKVYIFKDAAPKMISVSVKSFGDRKSALITPKLPNGWQSIPEKLSVNLEKKGDEQLVSFNIVPGTTQSGTLTITSNIDGQVFNQGLKTVAYDHIPSITTFPEATARLEKIDLKIVGKRIAYLEGAGDLVPDALKEMGYEVTKMKTNEIKGNDLSRFDAVITGVRYYNVDEQAKSIQHLLLKYVEGGGTLLVQYNVNNGLKAPQIGPYPFKLSTKRVTEEDATVKFLLPTHDLLNYPNAITSKDFEGWVQERGLYFTSDIDQKYDKILEINDTGETPSDGSLIVTSYGKGKFVYTSLAFFRELPAGVPGAYRIFANLIAPRK